MPRSRNGCVSDQADSHAELIEALEKVGARKLARESLLERATPEPRTEGLDMAAALDRLAATAISITNLWEYSRVNFRTWRPRCAVPLTITTLGL